MILSAEIKIDTIECIPTLIQSYILSPAMGQNIKYNRKECNREKVNSILEMKRLTDTVRWTVMNLFRGMKKYMDRICPVSSSF